MFFSWVLFRARALTQSEAQVFSVCDNTALQTTLCASTHTNCTWVHPFTLILARFVCVFSNLPHQAHFFHQKHFIHLWGQVQVKCRQEAACGFTLSGCQGIYPYWRHTLLIIDVDLLRERQSNFLFSAVTASKHGLKTICGAHVDCSEEMWLWCFYWFSSRGEVCQCRLVWSYWP